MYSEPNQQLNASTTTHTHKNTMATNEPLLNKDDENDINMADDTPKDTKPQPDDEKKIKRSPNRLMVDDVTEVVQGDGDNSCVLLSVAKMEELGLFRGDSVLIKGKKRHSTVCIALANEQTDGGKIRMNRVIRKNLRVKLGDVVSLHSAGEVKYGERIHVLPFEDSCDGITGTHIRIHTHNDVLA